MKGRALLFRVLVLLYLAGVAYLCFNNFKSLPSVSRTILGFETDKVVHFLMFFPFPIISVWCYSKLPDNFGKAVFRRLDMMVIGAAIAAFTELVQTKLVYRSGDFRDWKADILALGAASLISLVIETVLIVRTKRRKKHA